MCLKDKPALIAVLIRSRSPDKKSGFIAKIIVCLLTLSDAPAVNPCSRRWQIVNLPEIVYPFSKSFVQFVVLLVATLERYFSEEILRGIF